MAAEWPDFFCLLANCKHPRRMCAGCNHAVCTVSGFGDSGKLCVPCELRSPHAPWWAKRKSSESVGFEVTREFHPHAARGAK
jgi:hypothetical protein